MAQNNIFLDFTFGRGLLYANMPNSKGLYPGGQLIEDPPPQKLLLRSRTGPDSFIKTFHHIPEKAIQLFLKDRHTPSHPYTFLNAFFDTFHFTAFSLFVKDKNSFVII